MENANAKNIFKLKNMKLFESENSGLKLMFNSLTVKLHSY